MLNFGSLAGLIFYAIIRVGVFMIKVYALIVIFFIVVCTAIAIGSLDEE